MSASIGIGETKGKKMNDYIDRQAAIDALEKEKPIPFVHEDGSIDLFGAGQQNQWYRDGIAIMNLPSAEVEPVKRGKWIYDNQFHWYRASCSECGYMRATDIKADNWNGWNYCPNCGAKMENE